MPATETANNAKFLRNDNTWQTVTPANIGAAASSHGTHVSYSTTTPLMDGTASVGTATTVSRSDHVHPTDTSRAATSHTHDVYFDSTTSRSANTVLAAPNGSDGSASFRKLVASDLPSHNHNYIPLSGSTGITGTLRTNQEIQSTSPTAFRIACGDYGIMLRNDGVDTYFLLTNKNDTFGSWNDLRPFVINNSTGAITVGHGINGNLNGTATKADTVDGFHASASAGNYLRPINYGTSALTPGSSSLTSGYVYLQYE